MNHEVYNIDLIWKNDGINDEIIFGTLYWKVAFNSIHALKKIVNFTRYYFLLTGLLIIVNEEKKK